jgi:hypothetical protein
LSAICEAVEVCSVVFRNLSNNVGFAGNCEFNRPIRIKYPMRRERTNSTNQRGWRLIALKWSPNSGAIDDNMAKGVRWGMGV